MITRNYKAILGSMLASSTTVAAGPCILDVTHRPYYVVKMPYPTSPTIAVTTSATSAGISIGTSGERPTDDTVYNLLAPIDASLITLTLSAQSHACEGPDSAYSLYKVTITNISEETITIREIGYKQPILCTYYQGNTSTTSPVVLLDRTVLDTPIVIQAGEAAVIDYKLQSGPAHRQKAGIDLVSFSWGSPEQISAMIAAARLGQIDLQADAGWRIGDMRRIHYDGITGAQTTHGGQDIDIVISEFGDRYNCGSVLQFDFVETILDDNYGECMNSSATNTGGYGSSAMYSTTLPALVAALPEWFQNLLLTFSVPTSAGNDSDEIVQVPNNKLALRSEIEMFNTTSLSYEGEGSIVSLYSEANMSSFMVMRTHGWNMATGGIAYQRQYWLRSPAKNSGTHFIMVYGNYSPATYTTALSNINGVIAPFGCI